MKEARINGYVLAIEKLKDCVWWWKVTLGNQVIAQNGSYGKHAKTEDEAKLFTLTAYLKHVNKEKIEWHVIE